MIQKTDYDVYLGSKSALQGYRLRTLNRDSAPLIAPKFSSGAEGQTDLDLLKAVSVDDLSGGMFQRDWISPNKVARSIGVFNPMDRNFYPSPTPVAVGTSFSNGMIICKVESELVTYFVTGQYSAPNFVNRLFAVDNSAGTISEITLPSAFFTGSTLYINQMALHGGFLYISSNSTIRLCYRMDISNNTFYNAGGRLVMSAELRGVMYGINIENDIHSMANEFSTTSQIVYTKLDRIGFYNGVSSRPTDIVEFNSALWICKPEGIFRFDGVRSVKVLDLYTRKFQLYNGALYFMANHWLYKFDGTNVTKLQFFDENEELAICPYTANSDYLFIQTRIVNYSAYAAVYDKTGAGSGVGSSRVYMYDGQSFTLLTEDSLTSSYAAPYTGLVRSGKWLLDLRHTPTSSSDTPQYTATYNRYDLNKFFDPSMISATSKLEATSSEFDAGFPNILKTLNAIEVTHHGMTASDSLLVKYQIYDGKTWSAWLTLGTITSTSTNYLEVSDETMLYRRIKFNVTATLSASSTLKLKSLSMRYTIQPRHRWRWSLTVAAFGDMLMTRNNAPTTTTANTLSNFITQAIRQKTPSYFFSPDYGTVKTQATAAATTLIINGEVPIYTDPYGELQLIGVKNQSGVWEILRVNTVSYNSTTKETTITVFERGWLGIAPAIIPVGAEFHLCFRVYVTRLMRENTILSPETYDQQTTNNSQLQREFTLEITEV